MHTEQRVLERWHQNADPWITTICDQQISSRTMTVLSESWPIHPLTGRPASVVLVAAAAATSASTAQTRG